VWVEGGALVEPPEELEPLVPVEGEEYEDGLLTGVTAGAGAGAVAGAGAELEPEAEPPPDPEEAFSFLGLGRTWIVRWTTCVWTFGFGGFCAAAAPACDWVPSLDPSA
jgi:hypothetical protein